MRPVDVYCGVVPAGGINWPFDYSLVVELEVERATWIVVEVDVNVTLPGLRRNLLQHLLRMEIAHVTCCGVGLVRATYHASYVRTVEVALVLAVMEFKEHRPGEHLASLLRGIPMRRSTPASTAEQRAENGQPSTGLNASVNSPQPGHDWRSRGSGGAPRRL